MIRENLFALWTWVEIFILAAGKLYVFKSLSKMLGDIKINEKIYNVLCVMLMIVSMSIKRSNLNILLLFTMGIAALWLLLTVSHNASVVQRFIVLVSWLSSIIVSETLVESMIYWIYSLGIYEGIIELRMIRFIGTVCIVTLVIMQIRVYMKLRLYVTRGKWAGMELLVPLIANSIVMVILFTHIRAKNIDIQPIAGMLVYIIGSLLVSNLAIVLSAGKISKFYEDEMEQREIQKRSEAEYEYYSHLEEEQERIRLLYHDINNHISCIKAVITENGEINAYLEALEKEVQITKRTFKTGCSVVDAVLRQKSIICENKQIDLKVNLNLSTCEFMEAKELCSIFANALDNAIEACEKVSSNYIERYIHMESQVIKGFLVIKIKNSKEHVNKWINEVLVTQKKNAKFHGMGLVNIKRAIERYEGECIIKEETHEFYLKIVIPLKG